MTPIEAFARAHSCYSTQGERKRSVRPVNRYIRPDEMTIRPVTVS